MSEHNVNISELATAIRCGERSALGRGISLIESNLPNHQTQAKQLISELLVRPRKSHRIGITGPPGVGKSTFIDSLGSAAIAAGYRLAVLAIDPSSPVSGGSILGDRTRMNALSKNDRAFIRPSPSRQEHGGVGRRTREAIPPL